VEEMSDVGEDTLTIFTTGGKQYMMPNEAVEKVFRKGLRRYI
jgi:hypothetical protein